MVIWKKCCCCSLKNACIIIGILGAIDCVYKVKSDVEKLMKASMWSLVQDSREKQINILMKVMEELNINVNREGIENFVDFGTPTTVVDIFFSIFGLISCFCLVFGARKSSEKLLLPSLVFFPFDFFKCTVFSIVFAIPLGFSNPFAITIIVLNVINAIIYVPALISIYSLRQELLKNAGDGANDELTQQREDKV